jgi:hypothetical protein
VAIRIHTNEHSFSYLRPILYPTDSAEEAKKLLCLLTSGVNFFLQ